MRGMALSVERPAKRLRIVGKSNMQTALLGLLLADEDPDASREVYLVTLPHTETAGLTAPGTYKREGIRDAVLACCAAPEHDPAWLRRHPGFVAQGVEPKQMVIFS